MARPNRLALAAAGVALVVAIAPLAAGTLTAQRETVCLDTWAIPRPAPTDGLSARQRDRSVQEREAARADSGRFVEDAHGCELAVRTGRPFSAGTAWLAVLLASAAAGAAAWWLAGGTRPGTAPAPRSAATGSPRPQPPAPAPVGPVTLTPFGEHGGYVGLPHGVVVWATQEHSAADRGGALRPGEPVHIQPGPNRSGWVVGRDPFTPRGSER